MSRLASSGRRLFVAVEVPDEARSHLADELVRLRAGLGPDVLGRPGSGVRWSNPESWHLTLVFCGTVPPATEATFVSTMRVAMAAHHGLSLGIAGGGRFGRRVLWAGVTGDRTGLVALATSAANQARAAGIDVEDRPYRPHLTIARGGPAADLAPAAAALTDYIGPTWRADQIVLIESVLGASPARHLPAHAFPLTR